MVEYSSVSASSYGPAGLVAKLNSSADEGWEVVSIVLTGGDVTAFLRRSAEAEAGGNGAGADGDADVVELVTDEPAVEAVGTSAAVGTGVAVGDLVSATPTGTPAPVRRAGCAVAPTPEPGAEPTPVRGARTRSGSPLNRERIATDVARTSPGVGVEWSNFSEYLDHVRKGGGAGGAGRQTRRAGSARTTPSWWATLRRCAAAPSSARTTVPRRATRSPGWNRCWRRRSRRAPSASPPAWSSCPRRSATPEELIALSKVVARYGRIHTSHQRTRNEALRGVGERDLGHLRVATGARLQISHNNKRLGAPEGAWEQTMEAQEAARRRGLDVSCDTTSYVAGLRSDGAAVLRRGSSIRGRPRRPSGWATPRSARGEGRLPA